MQDDNDLVTKICIQLGGDGVMQSAEILSANYAEVPYFRALAESARSAAQKARPIKALII